jgi:S-layer protein
MLGSTGVTSVTNTGSSATLTVSNVALGTALTLGNTAQGGTFNYAAADVAGTADAATIDISSVTGGALTIGAGIEALTLNSVGSANTLGSLSSGATTLNITGAQNMTVTGNATATTIDASAATGKITVTSDNTKAVSITTGSGVDAVTMTGSNTLTDTVKLGAGNDKVTFTATLDDADIVDGGEGTDTLVSISADLAALNSGLTTSNLTNFEVVQISDQAGADLDISDIQEDGITTVTLAHSGSAVGLVSAGRSITGEAGALTINLGKSAAGNTSTLGNTLTVNDGADNLGTSDTVTINNTGVNSTTGGNINITNNLTSTGYENMVLNTGAGSGNVVQTAATITVNADAAASATSFTAKGNNSLNITSALATNTTGAFTIDASTMKAQAAGVTSLDINTVTVGTAGTIALTATDGDDLIGASTGTPLSAAASTVIAGAGADTIFTGAGNDTITGGSGKDTINSGTGNDTVDAGADNDTIDFSGNFTIKDSVDGGDGTDTLKVNNADATTVNAYSLGQINTLNGRISNIEKIDFGAASLTQAIDMARLDSISTVEFEALAGASTISGLAATNEIIFRETTGATLSLALADDTGTADVLNLSLKESDALVGNVITASNIETINIVGTDDAAGDVSAINTMTLTANKATSVVVTGNDGLNLTATGSTKVTNFDASGIAATNSLDTATNMAVTYTSVNTSSTANVTIKSSAGNDTIAGNNGHDTISTGGGTDGITMTTGNDVVTAGGGVDTYTTTEALMIANSGTTHTFNGGAGSDILLYGETAVINVVDADFRGFTSVENLTTGNGTNNTVFAANADAMGLTKITAGTGNDTLNLSSVDFDNAFDILTGTGTDVISFAASGDQAGTFVIDSKVEADDLLTGWTTGVDQIDIMKSVVTNSGTVGDNLANGNYYEGAAGSMVAGTAYDVIVLTGSTYTTVATSEDAVSARSTSATDALVIFMDASASAVMYYDADISTDNTIADTALIQFTDITTLAATAAAFAIGDFNIIA